MGNLINLILPLENVRDSAHVEDPINFRSELIVWS